MTKRLTIALVALALFVLVAVMPVSAVNYVVATNITQGGTVYIGEQGLNVTPAQWGVYTSFYLAGQPANEGDLTNTFSNRNTLGWWASAADLQTTSPTKTFAFVNGNNRSLSVTVDQLGAYPGNWYFVNATTNRAMLPAAISVADPSLAIKVWDVSPNQGAAGADVTGGSVPQGQNLSFKIETNMINALAAQRYPTSRDVRSAGSIGGSLFNLEINDGYIDIKVKDESGSIYTKLANASWSNNGRGNMLTRQNVSSGTWFWGQAPGSIWDGTSNTVPVPNLFGNWSTGSLDVNGQFNYPIGTYQVWAESNLNNMKENYKLGGADYTGKTVSATTTITLVSDTVKIQANKDSVVRSKTFSVTITGRPATTYHLWVKGTGLMTGAYDDQPPMLVQDQLGVSLDPNPGAFVAGAAPLYLNAYMFGPAGAYLRQNGGGVLNAGSVYADVANGSLGATAAARILNYGKLRGGTLGYANVSLSPSGTRTVEFTTTNWTKAQKYTIRVEAQFQGTTTLVNNPAYPIDINSNMDYNTGNYLSDEVDVKVEKGAVTIVAAGDQNYYLGEEIKFSGTNTETYTTYLFIMGPNLPPQGAQIQSQDPRFAGAPGVTDMVAASFQTAQVLGDNTWSWKWGTSSVALDAGTYTVYAVSAPRDTLNNHLGQTAFGTVSIIIKKPFVSATASQSTVAQGDKIFITGTAEGNPVGVMVWILGKNYPAQLADIATVSVNTDASFKHEVTQTVTRNLYPGQYFVVVQHPMQNNVFDIYGCAGAAATQTAVCNRQLAVGQTIFTLLGPGSLQGSDAAEALVQGINSPNVDDTYTKLQFLIETPVITIAPIGDKHVGDKFTITASTNLAVDDEILVQVYSSSFKPTQKSQSGEFSGATGTVKVAKGDAGLNKITFDVDSSTFKPDEYLVTETAVLQVATGTALFNVLEGVAPTAAPVVVTTAAPVVTTVAPVVTTAAPTPVPTTKSPGYGALIALIGLGAVAFIVVRRH